MEEISKNIFIETGYSGVVLGVLKLEHGILMVDSPLRAEDQHSWHAKVVNLGGGIDKLLLMMDTHIDRTLGLHAMDAKVLSHQNAVEIMNNRPVTARKQDFETGADWDVDDLPVNIHWAIPDLTYTSEIFIHWNESPIIISHQPGAHLAGSWMRFDEKKIIFVGDSLVVNQPPFLAWSNLDVWIEELKWLKSDHFKDYLIISGRNGIVSVEIVDKMILFLNHVKMVVDALVSGDYSIEKVGEVMPSLLNFLSFEREFEEVYQNRLIWGLDQYIQRYYVEVVQGH